MRLTSVFCLICIFHCATYSLNANSESREIEFFTGDSLFGQGKYFEAAIAYERIYYFSEDVRIRALANLSRAKSLKQIGQFEQARNDLQRSLAIRGHPQIHARVMYEMAFCDFMAGNYAAARSILTQMKQLYINHEIWYDAGILYALVLVMLEEWNIALDYTKDLIQAKSISRCEADSLIFVATDLFGASENISVKSPETASLLSTFMPGVGHMYAGYPGKGFLNAGSQLLALGITGLMAYGKLYAAGFIVGLGMFQMFYFGGIRQAGYLAEKHNLWQMSDYKSTLKNFILDLGRR